MKTTIDALGPDFSPETPPALLSKSTDPTLQAIVKQAAAELDAPMAIVTVVVDRMQYFLAHDGLPPSLVASRGTEREASFCQFVVRDETAFEVTDAANDERLPTLLIEEFGLASYLGVPVRAAGNVVGSLCVLDTDSRAFSPDQRELLNELAQLVDKRLAELTQQRRSSSNTLAREAMVPGVAGLRQILEPLTSAVHHASPAAAAIRSFLRLRDFADGGGATSSRFVARSHTMAVEALADCEAALFDVEAAAADALDAVTAIEQLQSDENQVSLSTTLHAAQDLARPVVDRVGGSRIVSMPADPPLQIPRGLVVGLLTAALTSFAGALLEASGQKGIEIEVAKAHPPATVELRAEDLDANAHAQVAADLGKHLGDDPGLSAGVEDGAVVLRFAAVATDG